MIKRSLIVIVLFFFVITISGQQYLLLKKPGKIKYFRYAVGDEIIFKTNKHNDKVFAIIYRITDTSLVVNGKTEVLLTNIIKIYRQRWGVRFFQSISRYAGLGFLGLDALNRTINGEGPILQKNTLIITAGLLGLSYALYPLKERSLTINKPWVMQTLDFSWN